MTKRRTPRNPTPDKFKPLTQAQADAWNLIDKKDIIFMTGPAGTSKTHTATAWAMEAVKDEKFEKVIFTRPVVEACESLGWLPGNIKEKLAPYMLPLFVCANKIGRQVVQIETMPIAYLRGVTFEASVTILDEAQNCTYEQLLLYLTRFGNNSKMIICGDTSQKDISNSGLSRIIEKLQHLPEIGTFTFKGSDVVRHPLVSKIADILSN